MVKAAKCFHQNPFPWDAWKYNGPCHQNWPSFWSQHAGRQNQAQSCIADWSQIWYWWWFRNEALFRLVTALFQHCFALCFLHTGQVKIFLWIGWWFSLLVNVFARHVTKNTEWSSAYTYGRNSIVWVLLHQKMLPSQCPCSFLRCPRYGQ